VLCNVSGKHEIKLPLPHDNGDVTSASLQQGNTSYLAQTSTDAQHRLNSAGYVCAQLANAREQARCRADGLTAVVVLDRVGSRLCRVGEGTAIECDRDETPVDSTTQ
jgi:hypothetical protein